MFGGDATHYDAWRNAISHAVGVAPSGVYLVGSAATGFSLHEDKLGRAFRPLASDLDIAIVDLTLFTETWNRLLGIHRSGLMWLPSEVVLRLQKGVYWGFIPQEWVPRNTSEARRLLVGVGATTSDPTLRGHRASCRLYRRVEDLEGYLRSNLMKAERAVGRVP